LAQVFSVLITLVVGLLLVAAPWIPSLWDANYFIQPYPALRGVVLSAFTRGAVTGLGLVNVVLAFCEARQQRAGRQ
jgi:hypothetical protein